MKLYFINPFSIKGEIRSFFWGIFVKIMINYEIILIIIYIRY
jgi:hypothetical protein